MPHVQGHFISSNEGGGSDAFSLPEQDLFCHMNETLNLFLSEGNAANTFALTTTELYFTHIDPFTADVIKNMNAHVDNISGIMSPDKLASFEHWIKTVTIKMSGCCMFGCQNRYSNSGLTFDRIPTGLLPFQSNRSCLKVCSPRRHVFHNHTHKGGKTIWH